MKLYNLFESIIIEEQKILLTENVKQDILDAINGKYNVKFMYKDDENTTTERYVQIYQLGMSKANNEMISGYQLGGGTKPTKRGNVPREWKQFRLDKIIDGTIKPTPIKFTQAVSDLPSYGAGPAYNKTGNKNMKGKITAVELLLSDKNKF